MIRSLKYLFGRRSAGEAALKQKSKIREQEPIVRDRFDREYYLATNPDVKKSGMDPVVHYLVHGWREGRNPTPDFSTIMYLMLNQDVLQSGTNPFYHYIRYGQHEGRSGAQIKNMRNEYSLWRAPHRVQDITFPKHVENAEALFVIIVPEHNTMSGGIYS